MIEKIRNLFGNSEIRPRRINPNPTGKSAYPLELPYTQEQTKKIQREYNELMTRKGFKK